MINSGNFKKIVNFLFIIGMVINVFSISSLALAQGRAKVQALVDRNDLAVGDQFTLTIEVSSDSSLQVLNPEIPNLGQMGFQVLRSWTGTESRSSYANGTFEIIQSRSFSYTLSPQKPGQFVIPPIPVEVEGQRLQTQSIKIQVGAQRSQGQSSQEEDVTDPLDQAEEVFNQLLRRRLGMGAGSTRTQPKNPNEAFFIQIEADKTKVYVGEQITVSWYLYTRGEIHDIDTLKYPSLSGFWKEDIELSTRLNYEQEVVNGIPYRKALLARYAIFPIKAGKSTIDSYKVKCLVSVPTALGFGFSERYHFTKASQPIPVEVLDVPTLGRPVDFSGAVGRFTVKASVESQNVVAHQPVSFKLRIEGNGNAKTIDLPPLKMPNSVEIYDTKSDSKWFKDGTSYKEFEIILVPREAGELVLPEISISAFDTQQVKFYNMRSESIRLNVMPGVAPEKRVLEGHKQDSIKQVEVVQLPDPVIEMESSMSTPFPIWLRWLIGYLFSLGVMIATYLHVGGFLVRKQNLKKEIQKRVKNIHELIRKNEWRQVGAQGTNLLYHSLGQLSGDGGSGKELQRILMDLPPSVRREVSAPVEKLMKKLELLSFAPEELVGQLKDQKELHSILNELEKLCRKALDLMDVNERGATDIQGRAP